MSTVYTNDLRLKEIGTGLESGTWGTSTNTNLSLIAEAFSYQTEATFGSDANVTTTIADGATDKYRAMYVKVTSSTSLSATRTLTIGPNTCSKVIFIENATSGNQIITVKQGSGATVNVNNGKAKLLLLEGTGASAGEIDALDKIEIGSNATIGGVTPISADSTTTFTNKTFDANATGNSISNIEDADISASAGIAFSKMANLTASRALVSDSNGDVSASAVTDTEVGYLDGVTSAIQTQLDAKLNAAIPASININSSDSQRRFYFTPSSHTYLDSAANTYIQSGSTNKFTFASNGDFTAVGNVGAYSDMALKEDIYEIENALDKVKKLRGVHFTKKADKSKEIGVVANEVEKVVPELVDEVEDEKLGTIKTMKYANTVGLLIEAVKDLSKQVEELKNGSSN